MLMIDTKIDLSNNFAIRMDLRPFASHANNFGVLRIPLIFSFILFLSKI